MLKVCLFIFVFVLGTTHQDNVVQLEKSDFCLRWKCDQSKVGDTECSNFDNTTYYLGDHRCSDSQYCNLLDTHANSNTPQVVNCSQGKQVYQEKDWKAHLKTLYYTELKDLAEKNNWCEYCGHDRNCHSKENCLKSCKNDEYAKAHSLEDSSKATSWATCTSNSQCASTVCSCFSPNIEGNGRCTTSAYEDLFSIVMFEYCDHKNEEHAATLYFLYKYGEISKGYYDVKDESTMTCMLTAYNDSKLYYQAYEFWYRNEWVPSDDDNGIAWWGILLIVLGVLLFLLLILCCIAYIMKCLCFADKNQEKKQSYHEVQSEKPPKSSVQGVSLTQAPKEEVKEEPKAVYVPPPPKKESPVKEEPKITVEPVEPEPIVQKKTEPEENSLTESQEHSLQDVFKKQSVSSFVVDEIKSEHDSDDEFDL